jgi:hypothetical protein
MANVLSYHIFVSFLFCIPIVLYGCFYVVLWLLFAQRTLCVSVPDVRQTITAVPVTACGKVHHRGKQVCFFGVAHVAGGGSIIVVISAAAGAAASTHQQGVVSFFCVVGKGMVVVLE